MSAGESSRERFTADGKDSLVAFLSDEAREALEALIDERVEARLAEREGQPCGWLDVRGAAAYLGWPAKRIYNHLNQLPHVRHGGRLMFRAAELDREIERHREGVQP